MLHHEHWGVKNDNALVNRLATRLAGLCSMLFNLFTYNLVALPDTSLVVVGSNKCLAEEKVTKSDEARQTEGAKEYRTAGRRSGFGCFVFLTL